MKMEVMEKIRYEKEEAREERREGNRWNEKTERRREVMVGRKIAKPLYL